MKILNVLILMSSLLVQHDGRKLEVCNLPLFPFVCDTPTHEVLERWLFIGHRTTEDA
jgi:hypothetical protein